MIESSRFEERGFTRYVCTGVVTLEDLMAAINGFYGSDPTPNSLWDVSAADVTQIPTGGMRQLAEFAKVRAAVRAGGRTAIVAGDPVGFGLARMYEAFAEVTGHEIQVRVFQDRGDAERWLAEEPG